MTPRRLRFFFAFFLLAVGQRCFSQNVAEKKISVEGIGIKEGLSQGMINAIRQDHRGFMWFGTMDGLNRYNGYTFQVFRNSTSDSTSISGNFITCIFEDSKKRLWIGTALNGLNVFLPDGEQFVRLTTGTKPALTNNTIISIQEDKTGALWIATQFGLNKLIVKENKAEEASASRVGVALPSLQVTYVPLRGTNGVELFTAGAIDPSVLLSKTGVLWVAAQDHLFKILPQEKGPEKIVAQPGIVGAYGGKSKRAVYGIFEDTTQGLVMFKQKDGFSILHEKTGALSFWRCGSLNLTLGRNQVVLHDGVLWDRTSEGLICFDFRRRTIQQVRAYNGEHDKILKVPFSIYRDRSGLVWIGSGGFGLLRYNPREAFFHKTASKSINWMSATPAGDVLFLMPELQYLRKTTVDGRLAYAPDTAAKAALLAATGSSPYIVVQDKQGDFWVNAKDGIMRYNPAQKKAVLVARRREITFPFYLDREDRLWFGEGTTLCRLNKTTGAVVEYPFPVPPTEGSLYRFCQAILEDANGVFWLGTTAGLFSFSERTGQWRHFKNNPGNSATLSTNIVFSLCDDPSFPGRYLWVGTNGGGLNRLCAADGTVERLGLKEGLPNLVVYGLLSDAQKQLWLSTNNGLACLQPAFTKTGGAALLSGTRFRYFFEENGLQSNEFNRGAYCKTGDGTLFFGGVNGFNYFNPLFISHNPTVPNVVITDFKINNQPVLFATAQRPAATAGGPLTKPVFLTEAIELLYEQNMFSFDFAALEFTAPQKNMYRYKMAGFDTGWIDAGATHTATYTNLDPGKYVFTVIGSNSDGVWNKKGASIEIFIPTPWYMSWWFRTALVLVFSALLYTVFMYRIKQKLKLSEIRQSIASDLHDEIGSTLNSVYIYSEVAQQTTGQKGTQTAAYLKQISTDTGNMIHSLNDIVWTVNDKNDDLENVINRMRAAAVELFEAKGYALHLQFSTEANTLKLNMTKRKNLFLFYKEAINNAAKYADGNNIWITLNYQKPEVHLCIRDDGRGFNADRHPVGNGLENLKKRAVALNGNFQLHTAPGSGTSVSLSFRI